MVMTDSYYEYNYNALISIVVPEIDRTYVIGNRPLPSSRILYETEKHRRY